MWTYFMEKSTGQGPIPESNCWSLSWNKFKISVVVKLGHGFEFHYALSTNDLIKLFSWLGLMIA